MGRKFNTISRRWDHIQSYQWSDQGKAWIEVMRDDQDDAAMLTSAFDHDAGTYLGRGTVLQRDISQMPVHPETDSMSRWMWEQTPFAPGGAWGSKTSLNTSSYGTQPVHMYVVDSTHPDAPSAELRGTVAGIGTPQVEVDTYMRGTVAAAPWMVPAQNGDRGWALYDVGTGIMRELFGLGYYPELNRFAAMNPNGGGDGTGYAVGGYSVGNPGLKDLAVTNYALQQRRGIATVSGMHNSLGFVGIAEALNKKIEHALCFTVGSVATHPATTADGVPYGGVSWPSRGADGKAEMYAPGGSKYDPNNTSHFHNGLPPTPTHGQWGRLKADVDPMHNPRTGKAYKPFTRVLIEAAKKYGLVATDTNLWCNAFNMEQGRTWAHVYGEDPWMPDAWSKTGKGLISGVYTDPADPSGPSTGISADDFPWDRTEWSLIDWGRPSPDWNLRPGQPVPWWRADDPSNPLNTMPR